MTEPNPERIRLAVPSDELELMELCRRNHEENGIGSFSSERVQRVFQAAFAPTATEFAVIGVVGGSAIEGSVGLMIDQPWDSTTYLLMERWNYVLPAYRHTTNLRDLTAWAKRMSAPAPVGMGLPLQIGAISTRRTESKIRLYGRQLGEPVAVAWLCETLDWRAH